MRSTISYNNDLYLYQRYLKGERPKVDTNTILGYMGESGLATGPHLHFEVMTYGGARIDPMKVLGNCKKSDTNNSGEFGGIETDNDGDGISTKVEQQLMLKYAPEIYVSSVDPWKPANTDWYIKRSSLWFFEEDVRSFKRDYHFQINENKDYSMTEDDLNVKMWSPYSKTTTSISNSRDTRRHFYLNAKDDFTHYGIIEDQKDSWQVYANVSKKGRINNGNIVITYGYFLPFNDPPDDTSLGVHEGDWEKITIYLDNDMKPIKNSLSVEYATHDHTIGYSWRIAAGGETQRPQIYIANGTHASFPSQEILQKNEYPPVLSENVIKVNSDGSQDTYVVWKTLPTTGIGRNEQFKGDKIKWESWNNIVNVGEEQSEFATYTNLMWGDRDNKIKYVDPTGPFLPTDLYIE